jgi:peptidoglycan/LPS O-acetylase OafA/YrhL
VVCFLLAVLSLNLLWLWGATVFLFNPDQEFNALALGYIFPLARLGEFAIGMGLSYFVSGRLSSLRAFPVWLWTFLEISALMFVLFTLGNLSYVSRMLQDRGVGPVFGQWVESSGGVLAFLLLILVFAIGRGLISKCLSFSIFVWLGKISFSMYLIHQPLIFHWTREVVPAQPSLFWQVFGYSVVLIMFSALLHKYVEVPGVSFGRWISGRLRSKNSIV